MARSTQTVEESEQSSERDRDDAVTVQNNLSQADAGQGEAGASTDSQVSRVEETVNFEVSRRRITEVRGAGSVERISVAVLIDGMYSPDEEGNAVYEPRTPEELQQARSSLPAKLLVHLLTPQ